MFLVIEDIDSMVAQHVKSFFLNELDGLASSPSPRRATLSVDDAVLNRPSIFDVKYDFALPGEPLRNKVRVKVD